MNAYELPDNFREFAFMPKWDSDIATLANDFAELEDWEYKNTPTTSQFPVLENYIKYTYKRIADEKKVAVTKDEKFSCWNTGLITPNQEPIFVLFTKTNLPECKFTGIFGNLPDVVSGN